VSWHKHIGAVILAALAAGILLAGVALAQNEKVIYDRARADYFWLQSHDTAKGVYSNWKSLADRFSRIFASHPQGPFAPGSLFWMAKIYQGAYKQFNNDLDYREAIDACKRLKGHFPKSRLADDAQMIIAELHEGRGELQQAFLAYLKVTTDYPRGDMNKEAKKRLDRLERDLSPRSKASKPAKTSGKGKYANLDPGLAAVTDLRHWSTKTYTRVVMSLERPVPYKTNLLKRDKDAGKPRRLYLDLNGARLTGKVSEKVTIGDGLLQRARAGQYRKDTVRLVLDIKQPALLQGIHPGQPLQGGDRLLWKGTKKAKRQGQEDRIEKRPGPIQG
jgi:N-acetylmuramoyl-L-alanine amidase